MRRYAVIILLIASLRGQNPNTPVFPAGTAADADLLVVSNFAQSILAGAINSTTTTITLSDASKFTIPLALVIDSEIMKCTSKAGNVLTCVRGQFSSAPADHQDASPASAPIVSHHPNQAAAEIKAIEAWAQNERIKTCSIVIGGVSSSDPALLDDDDKPSVCDNDTGTDQTIIAVACRANTGSPTVNPILTGGSSTSILSSTLTCGSGTWAAGTINGTPVLHSFSSNGATCSSTPCTLDANIVSAGGAATMIAIKIVKKL